MTVADWFRSLTEGRPVRDAAELHVWCRWDRAYLFFAGLDYCRECGLTIRPGESHCLPSHREVPQ